MGNSIPAELLDPLIRNIFLSKLTDKLIDLITFALDLLFLADWLSEDLDYSEFLKLPFYFSGAGKETHNLYSFDNLDNYYKIYLPMSVTFSTDDYTLPEWSGEPKYSS